MTLQTSNYKSSVVENDKHEQMSIANVPTSNKYAALQDSDSDEVTHIKAAADFKQQ